MTATNANKTYEKHRTTAKVGRTVELPTKATAITISDIAPFGDTVQVSWLQPVRHDPGGMTNPGTVHEHRTQYTDDSPLEIPTTAWGVTVYEPADANETVVYYLK